MRISDWSSDVCSSDLGVGGIAVMRLQRREFVETLAQQRRCGGVEPLDREAVAHLAGDLAGLAGVGGHFLGREREVGPVDAEPRQRRERRVGIERRRPWRSEEHTSELQSLMRISYAVFCLKKKTNRTDLTVTKRRKKLKDENTDTSRH